MKKYNTKISKENEICKKCKKTCKNKDGSALIVCDDYKGKDNEEK